MTRHFAKADDSVVMAWGSVVDAPTAGLYIANGANFVVGPMTNPEVARLCNRRGIPYSPGWLRQRDGDFRGAGTRLRDREGLSRRERRRAGLRQGGAGPMPWTKMMPTGGVEATEASLREWFGAGIVAAGIGSNLITKKLLDAKDYDGIERKVRDTVRMIKEIRGSK